jgi:hypothetical protein
LPRDGTNPAMQGIRTMKNPLSLEAFADKDGLIAELCEALALITGQYERVVRNALVEERSLDDFALHAARAALSRAKEAGYLK